MKKVKEKSQKIWNFIYNFSIGKILVIVFAFFMLLAIFSNGFLVYTQWYKSAETTTRTLASDINYNITRQLESFFHVPYHINETNHLLIENNIFDMSDQIMREKFFVGVIKTHDGPVYSFSYGTVNGEYYGARRNGNGDIEIMRNDSSTGGNSWYYSVNDDMTAADFAVDAGQFDARTRDWYKAAADTGKPVFSPIYKHFVMDDLTVSASWPIYDSSGSLQGVMGTHLLLSDISYYLEEAMKKTNGFAIIFEQDTNSLIATSTNKDIFTESSDGTLTRKTLNDIQNKDILASYNQYLEKRESQFLFNGVQNNLYINVAEININGIEWILLSALPESFFMQDIYKSMLWSVLLSFFVLTLLIWIYYYMAKKLAKPVYELLATISAFAAGDLSQRFTFKGSNEIGMISKSFNHVADEMQSLIDNLEDSVHSRTEELNEKKDELQLILDSTAEAIFGVDLNGNCTFCNISCIKLLGYKDQSYLIGKNVHQLIHHSKRDGRPFPIEECKIFKAIKSGQGLQAEDEVFWRADGTTFDVEYRSYPQIKNGVIVGGVVTFMDNTEKKQRKEEIDYLNCHDPLTGLYNRRCFETNKERVDIPESLPLSIIFADINGLKMTNDIFGHDAGDKLIKTSANILKNSCRDKDIIARIGGDEFVILLPETNSASTESIIKRIREEFQATKLDAIKCSVALGHDVKTDHTQSIEEVMANAENAMYKDKTINRKSTSKDLIDTVLESIHLKSQREEHHSSAVAKLCVEIGKILKISESDLVKLERAGYLHDIGKISLNNDLLLSDKLVSEEEAAIQQHAIVGYRLLNLFDDTLDIAEYIYNHHESWDGKGYPRGIKGEQIPLISRIISVAEVYDRVLNKGIEPIEKRKQKALEIIIKDSGIRFDPKVVDAFVKLMEQ